MYDYKLLEYNSIFKFFKEISEIPHGSGNCQQISDYCVRFAKNAGLEYRQDEMGNVLIKKPASKGFEQHAPILLQGHLDMVCEKDNDVDFDFSTDALKIDMQGDYIFAHGTTLGADNGIAVAICLSILQNKNLEHPPLEILFTVDEETGLFGANGLDCSDINARRLINLDSEDEGIFTVSCAGGATACITIPLELVANQMPCYKIQINGLQGGHSGVEIHKGRLNANILAGKYLRELGDAQLLSIRGGQKNNVIPAVCELCVASKTDPEDIKQSFINKNKINTDPDLNIVVTPVELSKTAYSVPATKKVADYLTTVPNGVICMSEDIDGLVQTSLNLGILRVENSQLFAEFGVRSSINNEKLQLLERLQQHAQSFNGNASFDAFYPAWEYNKNSELQKTMGAVWQSIFGNAPKIEAIHAGLECGFFCEKIQNLDAVSIGPDMQDIHTSRERLSISSTQRIYRFLLEVLKNL